MRDTVGISMSKDRLLKINLHESKIAGVVCSTNAIDGIVRSTAVAAKCDSILRGN